jgi:SAM-dependent methyltransferase
MDYDRSLVLTSKNEHVKPWSLDVLRCLACRAAYPDPGSDGTLACTACGTSITIANGIPRFVTETADDLSRRTQESFGYEWNEFDDWSASGSTNFADYFDGVDLAALKSATVLDAGCGMGRHARQIAPICGRIVAVDFSRAIEAAARNLQGLENVQCVQADLRALPLADGQFDFVYSLGVLHHLDDTQGVLRHLVEKAKPGGRVRIYLYWKRHGVAGVLLGAVTLMRRFTTRMPMRPLKGFSWLVSVGLAGAVVWPYRLLGRLGLQPGPQWPLSVYAKYPFEVLYNDQFDRLSAPLEKRYDAGDVRTLLERAGLTDIRVFDRYGWIGEGVRAR